MRNLILTLMINLSSISLSHGQILVSLLLGDKLNSDKLEFGGAAFTNLSNIAEADTRTSFFLGFYFDIVLKDQ